MLLAGGIAGALATGAVVGAGHALEADHVAAVATLVDDETARPARVGASWGIGHAIPVVLLGIGLVAVGVQLPATVTAGVETLIGLLLIALGARTLWRRRHHAGAADHSHLQVGQLSVGAAHTHGFDGESLAVGALHGIAGSGALVVLLVSTAATVGTALAFLAGFTLLSIGTMAAVSLAWRNAVATGRGLETLAGLASIAVGGLLLAEQTGIVLVA
ncbi:high-affinity nickel-transporter protein [Halosegnis sp.]|uniref:high-affinity nickel-transporter protein n=1 Tax=Halosegnis sp. TaxID=2864959 RepID=UPI0035D4795C